MARRSQLVCQQLEHVSSKVFDEYQHIIKQYTRRRNGVYALYKKRRLYYVGLATSLNGRLKQHLKDRHKGLWDRFSVYLTIGDHHIREMEALLIRIARPAGNKQIGKFFKCENLLQTIDREIESMQNEQRRKLFGMEYADVTDDTPGGKQPVLARYVDKIRRSRLRGRYKGKTVRGRVRSDGSITVRGARGRKFNSPTLAAIHVRGHKCNGWYFWEYERSPGEWVRLKHLRG